MGLEFTRDIDVFNAPSILLAYDVSITNTQVDSLAFRTRTFCIEIRAITCGHASLGLQLTLNEYGLDLTPITTVRLKQEEVLPQSWQRGMR